jgi:dTDP-4-amino-4,6-dideoxygalactose transaminase
MTLTNDDELAKNMAMLRSHGTTRDPGRFRANEEAAENDDPAAWYYEQQMLGFNYRMTDIHAALGLSQLERLSGYIERRNMLARRYDLLLQDLPLKLPTVQPANLSAFHLYVVRLKWNSTSKKHRQVFDGLRQRGIGVSLHYIPIHLQPYYRERGFSPEQYPEAEAHGQSAITLPLYASMTEQQQDKVVEALKETL